MKRTVLIASGLMVGVAALLAIVPTVATFGAAGKDPQEWQIHDRSRPQPPVITPGEASTQSQPGRPPSDATLLFDGKDLAQWESINGGPAKWRVGDGYFEVAAKTGNIRTKQAFGDCQLHVEWATPSPPHGEDQDRGNSGVFLHSLYEIQVLDSYQSITYPDGQAGAVYGQYPPLVNASRPPGQWQTYDIIFHGPRFESDGKVRRPAYVTVVYNGVLVQDHVAIMGPTAHKQRPPYHATPDKLPLMLQDHNHPVRFRNIWIRELAGDNP